jgi:hypothetical protein
VGFGGRVQPSKKKVMPRSVSFSAPIGTVEPSKLVDEEAEAVRAKAQEEQMEETEQQRMSGHGKPGEIQRDVEFGDGRIFGEEVQGEPTVVHVPKPVAAPPSSAVASTVSPSGAASSSLSGMTSKQDVGLEVPMTPHEPVAAGAPSSPRHSPTTREHACKNRGTQEAENQPSGAACSRAARMVRTVQFGKEEYHTMYEYAAECQNESVEENTDDAWCGEDELYFAGTPEVV